MLDHQVTDLADRFIQVGFEERRKIFSRAVLEVGERMNSRGIFHSSIHLDQVIQLCEQEIELRAEMVLKRYLKVLDDLAMAPYEGLSQDLKERFRYFLSYHSDYTTHASDLAKKLNLVNRPQALTDKLDLAIKNAEAEIDLFVMGHMRKKAEQFSTQPKEMDQKFKILMSAGQARLDFEEWSATLEPTGGSIAILFIDIDYFKRFNTKYTETIVDETILPDSMRLIQKLANLRGGVYRQGGEEFLVILPNNDLPEASAFAEKLRLAFEEATFRVNGGMENMTVSIGVAMWPQHGKNYIDVLKGANKAKAEAKGRRNTTVVAG